MHATEIIKQTSRRIEHSATFKLAAIGVLILVLLVPAAMVKSLIYEREDRKEGVINEIGAKWGREQTITGPLISIPYLEHIKDGDGKIITITRYLHILPDTVDIDSRITPEVRYRGIYKAILYNATLSFDGSFSWHPVENLRIPPENILWSDAFISLGIADTRGVKEWSKAVFDGKPLAMGPGVPTADVVASGISAAIQFNDSAGRHTFHLELDLNGSRQLNFTPVGKITTVTAHSQWQDPSFSGAFLPVERKVTEQGFTAKWKVLHLNRNYPQYWKSGAHDMSTSTFGVSLFSPVDIYQKSMRTAKYALMFIVFTFVSFFISEVVYRLRVHPVQYLLIGLAMIVFYALLLSISEQFSFGAAYLVSAAATIGLITGYARAILNNGAVTRMVGSILAILYAYLYVLLQLEDLALLMGSIGLFVVLSAVMYLTRKVDWYAVQPGAATAERVQVET
jgi:inner membrane protein